jgi:hypothetical protein
MHQTAQRHGPSFKFRDPRQLFGIQIENQRTRFDARTAKLCQDFIRIRIVIPARNGERFTVQGSEQLRADRESPRAQPTWLDSWLRSLRRGSRRFAVPHQRQQPIERITDRVGGQTLNDATCPGRLPVNDARGEDVKQAVYHPRQHGGAADIDQRNHGCSSSLKFAAATAGWF